MVFRYYKQQQKQSYIYFSDVAYLYGFILVTKFHLFIQLFIYIEFLTQKHTMVLFMQWDTGLLEIFYFGNILYTQSKIHVNCTK